MKKILLILLTFITLSLGEGYFQDSWYADFNGSAHNGLGDNRGGAVSVGIGNEYLYIVNSTFSFGITGKVNLMFDSYMDYSNDDEILVDEYGLVTGTLGGIMYVGESFSISYNVIYNFDTFHHDTYIDYRDDTTEDIPTRSYNTDDYNYSVTLGYRPRYYVTFYMDIRTRLIKNDIDINRRQYFLGLKFHI